MLSISKCRTCLNTTVANDDDKEVRLCDVEYEVVDQFGYLDDILSARGGAEASSISCIRSGWKSLGSFYLFLHLDYFRMRRKESYIQLVSEVSCCMAAKPSP